MTGNPRVLEEIKRLESMIPSGFSGIGDEWDFKKIWTQIKTTQAAFKGSRFSTQEERQAAWQHFQNLVSKVKEKQDTNRKQSAELRNRIVGRAERIPPSDDRWIAAIAAFVTIGISAIIEALSGITDPRKEALQNANKDLKDLWTFFTSEKSNMLPKDKGTTYRALKSADSRLQEAWNEWKKIQEEQSAKLRDEIIRMAEEAAPLSDLADLVGTIGFAVLTDGFSLLLEWERILNGFNEKEAELKRRSEKLREAWEFFKSEKSNLFPQHKKAAYNALKKAQNRLDEAWTKHREAKKKAMDNYHAAKRERHETRRKKIEQNLEKNRQRREKDEGALKRKRQNLEKNRQRREKDEGALKRKRQHLDKLYEDLNDARSDSYRERVEGWIEEDSNSIQEIEEKLENVNEWIEEDSNSIQEIEEKLENINEWIEEDSNSIQEIEEKLKNVNEWIEEDLSKLNN